MTDILELLRGKPGCQCAARSSYECCCDMARWPSDYVREAADEIERLRVELGITGDACGALDSEVKQLRARVAELEAERRRPCGDEQDCIWQPRCGMARRCLRPSGGLIAPIESVP